jgi:hypothetical protein
MAISVTQLAAELGAYSRANNKEIRQFIYQKTVTAKYMKLVTSIKGRFEALQSITGRLVQGFTAVWSPLGVTEFRINPLVNYQQKVLDFFPVSGKSEAGRHAHLEIPHREGNHARRSS